MLIQRYVNSTKFNTSLDLRTDQEAIRLVLGGASEEILIHMLSVIIIQV